MCTPPPCLVEEVPPFEEIQDSFRSQTFEFIELHCVHTYIVRGLVPRVRGGALRAMMKTRN